MKTLRLALAAVALSGATWASAAEPKPMDLRRGVPADVYMVVYGMHNPERDFQREYYKEVWKTIEQTQVFQRAVQIVASRLSSDQVEKAKSVLQEIQEAAAPMKLEWLAQSREVIYAQRMAVAPGSPPVGQHLLIMRLTPEAAGQTHQAIHNLFALAEKYSQGKIPVRRSTEHGAAIVTLGLPDKMPFRPTAIRLADVLWVASTEELGRQSLAMMVRGQGASKFDDPRLQQALRHLPKPEDSLVFYDARQQFAQMRGLAGFLRSAGRSDPKVGRVADLLDWIFEEAAVVDYEVTVEYTEGNLNRQVAFGKIMPGAEHKTLAKVFGSGKPFDDWQRWVPADAISYSLTTGANLHPLYQRMLEVLPQRFPETKPVLAQFEAIQEQIGVDLGRDLLEAFSGECVSVSLPAKPSFSSQAGREKVLATRCTKPERIRQLLHRLVDKLNENPAFAAQQLRLQKSEALEGFEELSALVLAGFGVKPVIGFRDGWMMIGSSAEAVERVLACRSGQGPAITQTHAFQQFRLEVDGPVRSIAVRNLAEDTRQMAQLLHQAGAMAPMILAMISAKAKPEELKLVQDVLGLLPSVGKIVSKFDFLESQLTVTQNGPEPGSYLRRTVTVIRPAPKR